MGTRDVDPRSLPPQRLAPRLLPGAAPHERGDAHLGERARRIRPGRQQGAVDAAQHDLRDRRGDCDVSGLDVDEARGPAQRLPHRGRDRPRGLDPRHARDGDVEPRAAVRGDDPAGRLQRIRPVLPLRRRGCGTRRIQGEGDLVRPRRRPRRRRRGAGTEQAHAHVDGARVLRLLCVALPLFARRDGDRVAPAHSRGRRRRIARARRVRSPKSSPSPLSSWPPWSRRSGTP